MADDRKYSRVYHDAPIDPRFEGVWASDAALALWLRLLVVADGTWPAPAPIPRSAKASPLAKLVAAGLVDLVSGDLYRVHGMNAERTRRAASARVGGVASGRSRAVQRSFNERSQSVERANRTTLNLDETSRDETSRDETSRDETRRDETARAPDPWDDAEGEAVTWLAKHGVVMQPSSGYYRHVVTMVEAHGINAVIGMFDRLASAGTKLGDVKGYVFGARDALDSRTRPSLTEIAKTGRAEDIDRDHQRNLDGTQRYLAELRGEAR